MKAKTKRIGIILIVVSIAMILVYIYNGYRESAIKETGVEIKGILQNKEHKTNRTNGKTEDVYLFTVAFNLGEQSSNEAFPVNNTVYNKYNNGDDITLIRAELAGNVIMNVKDMESHQTPILVYIGSGLLLIGIGLLFTGRKKIS